ncbi:MAG: CDP-alcohol phosphatidyltransferase family protein [Euryarchaeota archaeon]|nr:CDP-alcohol phosphatidyltransferase family protein [Euryarchaeota archaeon]
MIESIKELKKICQNSKAETMDWYSKIFYRNISVYLTKLLLHTSITANHVTLFTIVLGLAAGILFSFGTYSYILAGALLLQLWLIFDCVDGEIARYRGTAGICGKYIESLDHCITEPFTVVCVGYGLYVLLDVVSIFVLGVLVALFMVWSSSSANLVYCVIFVAGMHDMGDMVSRYRFYEGKGAAYKISTIRHIYNSYIKFPTTPTSFTVFLLLLTVLDILFINFCPDFSAGSLTLIFGPDTDVIYISGIFDHGLHFNFLYIYFLFFSIVSIIRGIVKIHNNFQGVCRYQQDAKQQQS